MIIGIIAFLFSAIGTWSAMHYYVYKNLASVGMNKPFLFTMLVVFALLVPLSRFLTIRWRNPLVSFIHWISMVWIGSIFLFSFWLLMSSVLRSGIYSVGFGGKIDPVQWISITAFAVLSMILWAAYQVLHGPKNAPFELDRSPRYQKNLKRRFVQISDVHLGLSLGTTFLESLVKKINVLEPDMIFVTGDFLDPEFPDDENAIQILKTLQSKEGVYAVSGNHDFYSGLKRFQSMMERSGIQVLNNETKITSSGIQICGIHDQSANRFPAAGVTCDIGKALGGIDPSKPSILLAHQPKKLQPAIHKRVDLVLSGHTHAGQIFPFNAIVRLAFKYLGGLYRLGPDTDLIVCTGTGFWGPPMRLGTDSQIVVVDFKF